MAVARELGPGFAARAAAHDAEDLFVAENYAELKARRVFSAGVPADLGAGGRRTELCAMLREMARACGSTALALSMHTHLLAATVWRRRQGQPVEPLLKRIVAEQLVLVSTGASDWLDLRTGRARRGPGGPGRCARIPGLRAQDLRQWRPPGRPAGHQRPLRRPHGRADRAALPRAPGPRGDRAGHLAHHDHARHRLPRRPPGRRLRPRGAAVSLRAPRGSGTPSPP